MAIPLIIFILLILTASACMLETYIDGYHSPRQIFYGIILAIISHCLFVSCILHVKNKVYLCVIVLVLCLAMFACSTLTNTLKKVLIPNVVGMVLSFGSAIWLEYLSVWSCKEWKINRIELLLVELWILYTTIWWSFWRTIVNSVQTQLNLKRNEQNLIMIFMGHFCRKLSLPRCRIPSWSKRWQWFSALLPSWVCPLGTLLNISSDPPRSARNYDSWSRLLLDWKAHIQAESHHQKSQLA